MESLFTHLGINWKLLIAQGVNFFILVVLLNHFLYKPLVKLINDRRRKIEEGLKNSVDAENRLREIELLKQAEIQKGEMAALAIIEKANKGSQNNRRDIIEEAKREAEIIKKKTEDLGRRLIQRELKNLEIQARGLIEESIFASVRLHPEEIDRRLVDDAVGAIKSLRS